MKDNPPVNNEKSCEQLYFELDGELAAMRSAHAHVVNELEREETESAFWRKTAADGLAQRDTANDRIVILEALLKDAHEYLCDWTVCVENDDLLKGTTALIARIQQHIDVSG